MRSNTTRGIRPACVAALATSTALIATLAACGEPNEGAAAEEGGSTTMTVAVQPTSFSAPFFIAQEKGWFEDEGLTVKSQTLPNAGAQVPLIASGEAQFAVAPTVPIIVASSQGLPLEIVAPSSLYGTDKESASVGIIAPGDSEVDSAADLVGKSVAVIGLKAAPEQLLRNAVEEDGGNADKVKMVQMNYPTGFSALAKGEVEGMIVTEPFIAQATSDGYKVISYPELETAPGGLFAAWVANAQFLNENGDAARAFVDVITKANEYATKHPDEVNDIVAEQQTLDDKAREVLPPIEFATDIDTDSLAATVEDVERFGWTRTTPTVDDLIWTE